MRARFAAWVVLALVLLHPLQASATAPTDVAARARSRAEGNDPAQAIALAKVLLATLWPAQVLKIRVDSILGHRVAGITLSGAKFHERLDAAGFLREVRSLIRTTLASAPVEEVDIWATVSLDAGKGAIVSGDLAQPTSRIVFSVTVRRADLLYLNEILHSDEVFWDADWRGRLENDPASEAA